jgi:hypothetical protein
VSDAWIKKLFWFYLLLLIWAAATATSPADPDLWHRLAFGEFLWKTGHFPPGDAFSYLADYPQIADHEWGSGMVFYALWQWGGGTAMVATKLATLTITLVLLVQAGVGSRRPTCAWTAFYVVVLLALLPSFQSTVRCMVFTHIFFALWLYWFQVERRGRPVQAAFYVLTMIVWANLHGGFVIGLAWLLAVTVIERIYGGVAWKKWAVRFGLCLLATLINPFGWQLWIATGRALVTTRRGFSEWAPVSWWSSPLLYPGYKLLFLVVLAALAARVWRRGWAQIDRPALILIGLFMALSLTSARHTSLFAAVAGALMPGLFPPERQAVGEAGQVRRLARMALDSALILVPLYIALIVLPGAGLKLQYPPIACPVGAVDFLRDQKIRGKLLVPFNYGSYALWNLRGEMRVSMDGRYDLAYRPETYRRVDDFFNGQGNWRVLLTTPAPDAILIPRGDAVYPKLQESPGWGEVYRNEADAVFLPR